MYTGYHNTNKNTINRDFRYIQSIAEKPNGLWCSPKDEWIRFCCNNGVINWIGVYDYKLTVDTTDLLIIDNANQLNSFNDKYLQYSLIDWFEVSKNYKGIIIKNYIKIINDIKQYDKYNFYLWFSLWDMDSACIWDLSSIENISKY